METNDHGSENDFSGDANSKRRNKPKSCKHVSFKSPSSSLSNCRNDSLKYDNDSRKYDHDSRKYVSSDDNYGL